MGEKEASNEVRNNTMNSNEINESTDILAAKTIFYGVHIPADVQIQDEDLVGNVFVDKAMALKRVKKYKKARFKVFDFIEDAEEFVEYGSEFPNNNSVVDATKCSQDNPAVGEKHSPFRGPTSQLLVKLRKGIETGDVDFVQQTIWDNPRYLIGSGDTPSILQEGFRYNAMHVAAKAKNSIMCELILNTISNVKFIKKLYVDDKDPEERARKLLDLYLNTPDKGLNETALHFAVKFGAPKCVEVLVSFPQCDRNLRNKHGNLPKDIICSRYDGPDAKLFSEQIANFLEDNYYVPVLRSEDNCASPIIGEPFSPTSPPNFNRDPLSPRMEIHAYAGPMNKDGAEKFRRLWRTPPRVLNFGSPKKLPTYGDIASLKLRDPEKGLERLGNSLANQMEVGWREYWPFLDSFIDLASEDGLRLFENYLSDKTADRYNVTSDLSQSIHNSNSYTSPPPIGNKNEGSDKKHYSLTKALENSPMWTLCQALEACTINDNSYKSPNNNHTQTNHKNTNGALNGNVNINVNGASHNGNCDHDYHDSLSLNPLLCIDKSLQVFAKRISNDIVYLLEAEYEKCSLIETQMKQLQIMMVSYMGDNRFESVDITLAHCRLACLVKSLFSKYLQDTNVQNVVNRIDTWVDGSRNNYDSLSSDDELGQNASAQPKSQHTICLLKTIRSFLNSDRVFQDVASEDECDSMWKQMEPCACTWENRIGKKQNGNKRLHMKNKFTSLGLRDMPRKLSFEENNPDAFINGDINELELDESEDEFYTPPGTPSLLESYIDDDMEGSDEDGDVFHETQLPDVEIFIEGDIPTKADYAAFNALKYAECHLTPEDYPNIYRWQHAVSLYNEKERVCWTSPSVFKYNLGSPSVTSTPVKLTSVPSKDILSSSPPYTPTKSWLRVTGANSPRASLKHQRGNVSFNL